MIDTINLLGIGFAARQGSIEYAHGKQKIGVLEPLQVIRHSRLGHFVSQRFQMAGEAVDGVERGCVVDQTDGKRGPERPWDVKYRGVRPDPGIIWRESIPGGFLFAGTDRVPRLPGTLRFPCTPRTPFAREAVSLSTGGP